MPRLALDPDRCGPADLEPAVAWLRDGGLLMYPTDTLYAVAADPASAEAVARLYAWKHRAAPSALPMIAADLAQVHDWFGALEPATARLADRFWPGPLSLLVPAGGRIVPAVHAGRGSVALRVPRARLARMLCAAFGAPLPATSANRSGEPATADPAMWTDAPDARVLIVDAGAAPGGAPSTIVDARQSPPRLIRDGAVPWSRVLESIDR